MERKLCESQFSSSVIFFNKCSAHGLAQIQSLCIMTNNKFLLPFFSFYLNDNLFIHSERQSKQ